jgi:hypothetical protein
VKKKGQDIGRKPGGAGVTSITRKRNAAENEIRKLMKDASIDWWEASKRLGYL